MKFLQSMSWHILFRKLTINSYLHIGLVFPEGMLQIH